MWKIKKKTKVTLISQPDMWLAMILPGPGEAGLPRTSSLGERTIRQSREGSCYIAFQMPVASKGPPQLIHCHSCKGGGGGHASNSAWSKRTGQNHKDVFAKATSRQEDESTEGEVPLSERSPPV